MLSTGLHFASESTGHLPAGAYIPQKTEYVQKIGFSGCVRAKNK
jgi:hypothetical protein